MKLRLSPFLQWRFNIFLYLTFGWKIAEFYIFFLGRLYFFLKKEEKSRIENAVSEVIGRWNHGDSVKEITREVFCGILSHYYEKLFIAFEDVEKATTFLKEKIISDDLRMLHQKLSKGNGVIIVTGHYGAIEYIPTLLAVNNFPVSMIAKFKTEQLKRKVYAQAEKYRIALIDAEKHGNIISTAISELRKNRIIVTQCDEIEEWRPSKRDRISFLGRTTGLDRTINIMQKRTGAEIVFGIIHRYTLAHYRLRMYGYEDMSEILQGFPGTSIGETILKFLETLIYAHPEQWYQWKKYLEINNIEESDIKVERQPSPRFLKPAFVKL